MLFCLIKHDKISATGDAESTALKSGACPPWGEDKPGTGNRKLVRVCCPERSTAGTEQRPLERTVPSLPLAETSVLTADNGH